MNSTLLLLKIQMQKEKEFACPQRRSCYYKCFSKRLGR
jgi:hypothetical protein